MREIKFRGKHIHAFLEPHNTGIWVYGYLCDDHYINSEELMGEMLVDKDSVGQYTGLKDKNGVEIYEGDIVKIYSKRKYVIGKVIYEHCGFIVDVMNNKELEYGRVNLIEPFTEVIGNIYENPELIEKEGK